MTISKLFPRAIGTITLLTVFLSSYAQIETDRPDFTNSPNLVPEGALQIETGFVLENDEFSGSLYIPELASGNFSKADGQKIAPEFLIPMSFALTDKLGIACQYGLTWDGLTPNPTSIYSVSFGYKITDQLGVFVEPYGFVTNHGGEKHLINGGFTYLINNHLQLDLTGGYGLNEAAPNNFLSCGASFLLFDKE